MTGTFAPVSSGEWTRHDTPFTWANCLRFFEPQVARTLADEFPQEGFSRSVGRDGHYMLSDRTLVDGGTLCEGPALSPLWSSVIEQLMRPEYAQEMSQLLGTSLAESRLKVRLCTYEAGCWMLPHTDRPDRRVTQIVYVTPDWDQTWGGNLRILNSANEDDVTIVLPPMFNTSVAFVRSDTSFHAVERVRDGVAGFRRSLLIQFVDVASA